MSRVMGLNGSRDLRVLSIKRYLIFVGARAVALKFEFEEQERPKREKRGLGTGDEN